MGHLLFVQHVINVYESGDIPSRELRIEYADRLVKTFGYEMIGGLVAASAADLQVLRSRELDTQAGSLTKLSDDTFIGPYVMHIQARGDQPPTVFAPDNAVGLWQYTPDK